MIGRIVAGAVVLVAVGLGFSTLDTYTPIPASPTTDATWAPATTATVAPMPSMTLGEVRIVARATPRRVTTPRAQDCAFGFRAVAQGPVNGQVRGFCPR